MKFEADKDVLAEAVNFVVRLLPQRASLPILSGVLIEAKNDQITLSVFDYEVSAKSSINANVTSEGTVLVLGKLLSEIVNKLPKDQVAFELVDNKVNVSSASAKFNLLTMPTSEYPELPSLPESSGSVEGQVFAQAVTQVAHAASKEDVTPVLTGVLIEAKNDSLSLVATDRYRVAVKSIPWKSSISDSVLIPARTLQEIARTFSNQGSLSISIEKTEERQMVAFSANDKSVTSVLLKGNFPAVLSLFPESIEHEAIASVDEIVEATKRVSLVVEGDNPIRYNFSTDAVNIKSITSETAQASEDVAIDLMGEETGVSLKPQFVLDGLSGMTTDHVSFGFTKNQQNPTKPGPLMFTEKGDKAGEFKYLLQPNLLDEN
ncbi:MAG: DNA polymerase III subunit beta [Microbacteriaceae bacterium]|nr:DNA polymerase III subunit beta [Microbacteriaceae bacterium]